MELEDPVAFLRVSDKLARLEESKTFDSKKWVWITDPKECFKAAEVKSSKGDIFVVETNDGQVRLNFICVLFLPITRTERQSARVDLIICIHTRLTVIFVMSAPFAFQRLAFFL